MITYVALLRGVNVGGANRLAPEQLVVGERELYLHLPDGMGRSRLAAELARRRGDVEITIRNWRTVTKLLELAAAG